MENFLLESRADVIGLQEVWEKNVKGAVENQASKLAEALGYSYSFCPALNFKKGGYTQGNAILSKYPIRAGTCHLLSEESLYKGNAETEPRTAGEAMIEVPEGEPVRVFNTHLAFSHGLKPSKIRDIQMEALLNLLKQPRTVLMGDFNVLPASPEIKNLNELMRNTDPVPISPSWRRLTLESRLDHIFISKDLKELTTNIGNTKGSDHLPVMAEVEV